jgi:phosphate transport system protein
MKGEGEHILSRFDDELEGFRSLALNMGEVALVQVQKAVAALTAGDVQQAHYVCERETSIDQLDIEAQERSIKLFALHHPVARDLRFIVAVSRTITDLERIGDEAEKIARLVIENFESNHRFIDLILFDAAEDLMSVVADMLARSLDAVERDDVDLAVAVIQDAAKLDRYFDAAMRQLATYILEDVRNIKVVMDAVIVLKALERVGAHAANIAENVVLYITGKDVRYIKAEHLSEGYLDPQPA